MKPLLIVATGRCVWDDIAKVKSVIRIDDCDTMGVNYMILHWPGKLKYAVSWHSDCVAALLWLGMYSKKKHKPVTYAPRPAEGVDHPGRFYQDGIDTSGMYAVCVGLYLGYDKIIMAGVPFDDTGHFYDAPGPRQKGGARYSYSWPASVSWDDLRDKEPGKIRPVSGSLTKCFGEFSEEWLKE